MQLGIVGENSGCKVVFLKIEEESDQTEKSEDGIWYPPFNNVP